MRLALYLSAPTPSTISVELHDAANLSTSGPSSALAVIAYERGAKKNWVLMGTTFPNFITQVDNLAMWKILQANKDALKEAEGIKQTNISPLLFVRALLAKRAVQVAYDVANKKFRCVGTMKEGASTYDLVGIQMSVEASDEETAVRIAKREVANEMTEHPEKAAKLVAFFSGGCKVKLSASGALPEYMKVESLAENPAEEKLAKTPLRLSQKDEDLKG